MNQRRPPGPANVDGSFPLHGHGRGRAVCGGGACPVSRDGEVLGGGRVDRCGLLGCLIEELDDPEREDEADRDQQDVKVDAYIAQFAGERDERGRQLVVRAPTSPARS